VGSLDPLVNALGQVAVSLWQLVAALVELLAPHWPLVVWVVYFLFFVRWPDLRAQLRAGAWTAVVLLSLLVALVWGWCSAPSLTVSGWVVPSVLEKSGYVVIYLTLAFICGAAQDACKLTPPDVEISGPPEGPIGGHGHDEHGHGHSHGAHASTHGH
jgi:hypothetical protein